MATTNDNTEKRTFTMICMETGADLGSITAVDGLEAIASFCAFLGISHDNLLAIEPN